MKVRYVPPLSEVVPSYKTNDVGVEGYEIQQRSDVQGFPCDLLTASPTVALRR
jgi:hypothetical protein